MARYRLFILILLVFVLGCSREPDQAAVEQLFEGKEPGIHLHYFYEDASMSHGKAHVLWWSDEDDNFRLNAESIHNHLHDVGSGDNREWAKDLGLSQFPVFVLTNQAEILSVTNDLEKVRKVISREMASSK
ncbi:hypothetical protein JCM10914A_22010 [Paenibacillus sp. JCM 10914]|uniref:hypothetical protein n=1 Tax=Paenibacillus sp. JCM 10914 TaxID=1236974 RepID=UPI0003CC4FBE|nr:hypothetical protein [Paenibacillus sp. JCM 10914]GAE09355.1 hypothetical protein JCM10914_5713 [Paenibacillus sp. JCM 10914]